MEHRFVQEIERALNWSGPFMLGKEFAHGSMTDPALPSRLLTPYKLLDLIMRRSLATPQFRCFQAGEELHPSRFLSDTVSRRGQSVRVPDMSRLGRLLEEGCTLVLDEANFFDPTMEVSCRALQWWSHELVQVNTYLTTQNAAGFSLHWDDHDVVIVQLSGEKSWEIRGTSRPAPMYRDAESNNEPPEDVLWTGTMSPGDIMHIPRGYWHQATRTDRGDGYSLHATFGFVKRAGANWIAWLADRSREHELFRLDLERWATRKSAETQQETLVHAAAELLKAHPPAEFLSTREKQRPAPRHIPHIPIFGDLNEVVCVTEFPPHIEQEGDFITVQGAGKKITFTTKAAPALRMLLSGTPVNVAAAAEYTDIDAAQLADVLTKEGLCAQLTPELSLGYTDLVTNEIFSKAP
ncbi:cupin [Nocardiopsis eucommiae]|uniref:Cupin n=1 Tax=Nocardiopsis eucommiae TaxID=2831970 RepID=A0A975L9D3_9ACTN|nr:cupin [Nocardiopsis eucommiae]